MKRVIGIDLGSRRIGVAVSDGLGLTLKQFCEALFHKTFHVEHS